MSEQQIGKHKGAVKTLLHEKKELSRLLQIVNSQIQRHLQALDEAGVDTDSFVEQLQQQTEETQKPRQQKKQRQKSQKQEKQRSKNESSESSGSNLSEDMLEGEPEFDEEESGSSGSERDFNPHG